MKLPKGYKIEKRIEKDTEIVKIIKVSEKDKKITK